jgi:hypothetical protein
LFSLPYRQNWQLCINDADDYVQVESYLELSDSIKADGSKEYLAVYFKKE